MTFLLLVTQPAACLEVHEYVLKLIEEIYRQGHGLRAVFFTSEAAALGHDSFSRLGESYLSLSQSLKFSLLCCGRAYRSLGFAPETLRPGFELAGNLELTVMMHECDKTVEF